MSNVIVDNVVNVMKSPFEFYSDLKAEPIQNWPDQEKKVQASITEQVDKIMASKPPVIIN